MLLGGLLTVPIKQAAKEFFKTAKKTGKIVKDSKVSRATAKSDVKAGLRDRLKTQLSKKDKLKNRSIIRDINKLK